MNPSQSLSSKSSQISVAPGFINGSVSSQSSSPQTSVKYPSPSASGKGPPPTQEPPIQVSIVVQSYPSMHSVPGGAIGSEHIPVNGLQVPAS